MARSYAHRPYLTSGRLPSHLVPGEVALLHEPVCTISWFGADNPAQSGTAGSLHLTFPNHEEAQRFAKRYRRFVQGSRRAGYQLVTTLEGVLACAAEVAGFANGVELCKSLNVENYGGCLNRCEVPTRDFPF